VARRSTPTHKSRSYIASPRSTFWSAQTACSAQMPPTSAAAGCTSRRCAAQPSPRTAPARHRQAPTTGSSWATPAICPAPTST